ncbi:MAG: ribbon-helix-helix domain-containing protein [Rhodospirillaceae bacterium]|nr:ribbon-helix-helix domain-containing protein [Rhodospirillaceae bacterium]
MPDGLKKRSVDIDGHRTSVSIEAPFWDALREIAAQKKLSVNQLIAEIDKDRAGNLSSAIRVYVLRALQRYN